MRHRGNSHLLCRVPRLIARQSTNGERLIISRRGPARKEEGVADVGTAAPLFRPKAKSFDLSREAFAPVRDKARTLVSAQ